MSSQSSSTCVESTPPPMRLRAAHDRLLLPYPPRPLTLRELQKQDIHSYYSPKRGELIRIASLARLGVALDLEWDPATELYVERPRKLQVGEAEIEFSFFHRLRSGREFLTLVVTVADAVRGSGGRHRHREAEAILSAAEAARLPLRFVLEPDVPPRSIRTTNQFRLLPSVQAAHRLANRQVVRQRILEAATARERLRIQQIEQQLGAFCVADVYCGVADLLHSGELAVDWDAPIGPNSLVWRAAP
jgi:hypothetical protein